MRVIAFRYPVDHVEGEDADESLARVAALLEVLSNLRLCWSVPAARTFARCINVPSCGKINKLKRV